MKKGKIAIRNLKVYCVRNQYRSVFLMKGLCAFALILYICPSSFAQESDGSDDYVVYRPKIIQFDLENIYEYKTSSTSEQFGKANTEVETDKLFKLKVGVPIVLKKDKKIGLQFKYSQQRFNLDLDNPLVPFDLYEHLNGEIFKSLALRFLYEKNISENKKITLAGGSEIRSDRIEWNANSTKHFISASYNIRKNARTDIGFGFAAGYSLGRYQFYPLLNYSRKLSHKWTLDFVLPKSASLRYMVNEKLYIIARTQVKGWRYNLNKPIETGLGESTLRKADLLSSITVEREIHDWLWLGAEFGLINNLRYYLAEPGDRARDAIIDLRSNDATYFKASIFIVPPRKFYK